MECFSVNQPHHKAIRTFGTDKLYYSAMRIPGLKGCSLTEFLTCVCSWSQTVNKGGEHLKKAIEMKISVSSACQ